MDSLKKDLKNINNTLLTLSYPLLGDIFTLDSNEIEKTFKTISIMIYHRRKDIELKNSVYNQIQQLESENKILQNSIEKLNKTNLNLENENNQNLTKIKISEKNYKEFM